MAKLLMVGLVASVLSVAGVATYRMVSVESDLSASDAAPACCHTPKLSHCCTVDGEDAVCEGCDKEAAPKPASDK